MAQAEREEGFRLVAPDGLPTPRGIYSGGPQTIAFIYDLQGSGRVVVLEGGVPDIPAAQRREEYQAAEDNGRSQAIRIRGEILALASQSCGWAAIEWVEHGTQVSIQMRHGTREQAIAIANQL